MRVLIMSEGTRGDVQPCLALAVALARAGHEAVVATCTANLEFAGDYDVSVVQLDDTGSVAELELGELSRRTSGGLAGLVSQARWARAYRHHLRRILNRAWDVAKCGADLVVHPPEVVGAAHVAEKLKVPAVFVPPIPWVPTRELSFPFVSPTRRIPGVLNPATYRLQRALVFAYDRPIDDWRESTLGLRRRRGRFNPLRSWHGGPTPVMNTYSRHVVPPPGDTPAHVRTTGYLFLPPPPAWEPPPELTDFLDRAGTTVYIGFGSMIGLDPAATWRTIRAALALTGLRAVVCSGWGGLAAADVPATVAVVNDVPHEWLLPRLAATVHHGGAGTTGAAFAAGRPQVICPYFRDQPFWAHRAWTLGVAPRPIPQRDLNASTLAAALTAAVSDADMAERADRVGRLVRAENGTATAVSLLEAVHAGFAAHRHPAR
ncbi:glycosyltransferase [Virgisporangium aurantiacum]|uniref:Glycosyl transferase family 1 n=1 Tax=Virgisporangium aurantiacum TaxID=175570 RepID=A0A8J4DYG6_9ACTN|nr:nucleotide disphospho-sugar-binding domain-containing protein [Virgisporangium aurantiacum]GIJ55645.1 glycosyl transferase family 1 [Virgisporangium aurantiacum]